MRFGLGKKWLLGVPVVAALALAAAAVADTNTTDFNGFNDGTVNGQNGWRATSPTYDQAIVSTGLPPSFGAKALRISDAVTSGSFDDWVFANPVANAAGEATARIAPFEMGQRQLRFEASFDILSADPAHTQGGLHLQVSPDPGNGGRMSYLVFEDTFGGIDVTFADVQGENASAEFVYTVVATDLDRSVPHTVKFDMDFVDGPSNDVVKIYIDGALAHTGTSWENYYRFIETGPATPWAVKTLIFQSRTGDYLPAHQPEHNGKGFLIDNVTLNSSEPAPLPPGQLTVKKVISGGGPTAVTGFGFKVNNGATVPFDADGEVTVPVTGAYTVTEPAVANYTPTYDAGCTGTLASEETATCTITNTYNPPPAATATIVLQQYIFTGSSDCVNANIDATPHCMTSNQTQSFTVTPGSHTVSQNATYVMILCTSDGRLVGSAIPGGSGSVNLTLTANQTVNCTIYNYG